MQASTLLVLAFLLELLSCTGENITAARKVFGDNFLGLRCGLSLLKRKTHMNSWLGSRLS